MPYITSRKNAEIQYLRCLLKDPAARRAEDAFVCQGAVMLDEAIKSGAQVRRVYCLPELESSIPHDLPVTTVTPEIIDIISGVEKSAGIVFTCRIPESRPFSGKHFIALENVRDPGNVGTVIRTADALGVDGVVFLGSCADCFSPKVVRSTMGSVFRMPLYFFSVAEFKQRCSENNIEVIAACLADNAFSLTESKLNEPCCVMIGNEAKGLSADALSVADRFVIIPMKNAESLNAAVASAVFMWEMVRL